MIYSVLSTSGNISSIMVLKFVIFQLFQSFIYIICISYFHIIRKRRICENVYYAFLSFISAFSIYNLILCLPFPKSHFIYYIVWKLARLIFNPKIIQIRLILILCCQTGIGQITFFVVPFLQSTIIEQLQIILNNERNNIVFQTLLKHNQSAHASITIRRYHIETPQENDS